MLLHWPNVGFLHHHVVVTRLKNTLQDIRWHCGFWNRGTSRSCSWRPLRSVFDSSSCSIVTVQLCVPETFLRRLHHSTARVNQLPLERGDLLGGCRATCLCQSSISRTLLLLLLHVLSSATSCTVSCFRTVSARLDTDFFFVALIIGVRGHAISMSTGTPQRSRTGETIDLVNATHRKTCLPPGQSRSFSQA